MIKKLMLFALIVLLIISLEFPVYAKVVYSSNFENENVSCWNNISVDWRSCGDFYDIGKADRMTTI